MSSLDVSGIDVRAPRDVIDVRGGDAVAFLQGQLSADVAGLGVGESAWSLLLEPQGKMVAWLRATRVDPQHVRLDLDAGAGEAAATRLRRFMIRVDVTLDVAATTMRAVRGDVTPPADEAALPIIWPGVDGYDVVDDVAGEVSTDDEMLTCERLRITAGVPRVGAELDPSVIPAEVGRWFVDGSASFTKGCYTGQELVARVDSRGSNTPRHLRVITVSGGVPSVGDDVVVDGAVVGQLTSVAATEDGGAVALAFVRRSVEPPASALVGRLGAQVTATPAA